MKAVGEAKIYRRQSCLERMDTRDMGVKLNAPFEMCLSLIVVVFRHASNAVEILSCRKPHIGLTNLHPELVLPLLEALERFTVGNAAFVIAHFTSNTTQSEVNIDEKIFVACGHAVLLYNIPGTLKVW